MPKMTQPEGFQGFWGGSIEYKPAPSGVIDILPEHVELATQVGFKPVTVETQAENTDDHAN